MRWRLIIVSLILLMPTASAWSIDPAKWTINMLEEPEITTKHLVIRVDNCHNTTLTVIFTPFNDAELIDDGYTPLPNLSWVEIEEQQVTIPPHTKYEIPVTIEVENTTENYNKTWQFFIYADQIAGGETDGETTLQFDYNLRWNIITPKTHIQLAEKSKETSFPLWVAIIILITVSAISVAIIAKKRIKVEKDEEDIFG